MSDRVLNFPDIMVRKQATHGGSEPPMDITARVGNLEIDMRDVREGVAVIKSNYATKEDLHREIKDQTWKVIIYVTGLTGTVATGLVAATYFIAKHVS